MKFISPLSSVLLLLFAPVNAFPSDIITLLKTQSCINCDLSFADLNYSKFRGGDLSGSNLSYLNASRSTFFDYSFRAATLSHANFKHARLISSDFTDVIFDNTIFHETVVTNSVFDYDTVPFDIIINSINFPIHNLSQERLGDLLSVTSPDTHADFYLSLLNHLKTNAPDDPSISLLLAHFFFKYQLDLESSILSLEEAALQFRDLSQPEKSDEVNEIIKTLRIQSQNKSSFKTPNAKGNGLGITGINSIGKFISDLLPALTTLGKNLIY